jgi:pyruvate dehydrogenase E2 component (dihydrolipoamide acetyltransferase)
MAEFLMPKLGADMTEGRLVAWRKKPGDSVHRGDIVAEIETDKGIIDVEIFTSGTLEQTLVEPGTRVAVGTPLAVVRSASDTSAAPALVAPPPAETVPQSPAPRLDAPALEARSVSTRIPASPAARRLARELGVDLSTVHGSGPHGAIGLDDIRAAAARPPGPAKTVHDERASAMRRAIASAMSRSKREIPHYYLSTTIDMHRATQWLTRENERLPVAERLLYGALVIKAVATALRGAPELNASWIDGRVVSHPHIHVGVAISLRQGGLVAPAIHHTDTLSITEVMQRLRDLVQRARSGSLRSSEISDPTITITSLGDQGVESVFGVIYPPQVALLGFGKIVERPWVVEGQIVPRPVLTSTLSADHRVSDGHRGARFLAAIDRLLQEPESL